MACIKTNNDIITQPAEPTARQAVTRAHQTPVVREPGTEPTTPALDIEVSSAAQTLTAAQRAVRKATTLDAVREAVTDGAHALDAAHNQPGAGKQIRTLTRDYRSLQAQGRNKMRALGYESGNLFSDGTAFESGPRKDGKTQHFSNETGSMADPHLHVVEGLDSTPEHTTYDHVRDADGNVYIDRR